MSFNLSFLSVEETNGVFVKNKMVLKSTVNLDFFNIDSGILAPLKFRYLVLDILNLNCGNLNFISLQAGSYI